VWEGANFLREAISKEFERRMLVRKPAGCRRSQHRLLETPRLGTPRRAYNFVKPHGTLTKTAGGTPTTPAMAAGVATKPWSYEDVISELLSN
jgi:hypothetical protein